MAYSHDSVQAKIATGLFMIRILRLTEVPQFMLMMLYLCVASTSDGKDTAVDRAYSGNEVGEVEYTNKFWQKQFWLFKKKTSITSDYY